MNTKKEDYKPIHINQYINLLKKLQEKELLNSDGDQYLPEKYCIYEDLKKEFIIQIQ